MRIMGENTQPAAIHESVGDSSVAAGWEPKKVSIESRRIKEFSESTGKLPF